MARRTKDDALATRDHILDAAELVFEQRGVSRCSLQEVAQAAGVTRGAIYWHFENKADLANAMFKRVTLPLEEQIHRSADPDLADPLLEVRNSLLHALRTTMTDPQVQRVFTIATQKVEYVDELLAVRDRRVNTRNGCLHHVEIGLKRAMVAGRIDRRVPASTVAVGLHALVDGLIINWLLDPSAFDLVKVGTQALDAYLAGLALPTLAVGATRART
jgi:TetR/AcrR family acrAB operon transcriptional repressor